MSSKFALPKLPYAYDALEPHISKQIMELHHSRHHQTYVNNLNALYEKLNVAVAKDNIHDQIALQAGIRFNGGGHINHTLFFFNLSPKSSGGGNPGFAPHLSIAIKEKWGSIEDFILAFNTQAAALQGSGWVWLVKDNLGYLSITITQNQDPVLSEQTALIGVDMWEHAYYLLYYNNKNAYLSNIWEVINWKAAEERFVGNFTLKL